MSKYDSMWSRNPRPAPPKAQDAFVFLDKLEGGVRQIDILQVDAETLRDAVAVWTNEGYAMTFGRTQDGGAIGVHLLAHGNKKSKYFADTSELENFLQSIANEKRGK